MTKTWAGRALIAVGFAVAVGCSAPTIGLEPGSSTTGENDTSGDDDDSSSKTTKKHVQSGDDDDDDDNETTVPTGKTTTVTATDAGAADAAAPCTETGAVQFGGHCYFALTTSLAFTDAQAACVAKGAHLATLSSSAEESAASAIDSGAERWIGLRRQPGTNSSDASYAWVTPEPRNGFSNWDKAKNEPDGSCPNCGNTGHDAECARELSGGAGWADDDCVTQHDALCERD